jgi:hypothetical protein
MGENDIEMPVQLSEHSEPIRLAGGPCDAGDQLEGA